MVRTDASPEEIKAHERLASEEAHDAEHHVHVTPFWPMFNVFAALIFLTIFTALTAHYIDLPGKGNIILAMAIAITKGSLVAAYFMHLRYDKPMNTVVVAATLFAVILFLAFTMGDIGARSLVDPAEAGEIVRGGTQQVVQTAAQDAEAHGSNPDGGHGDGHAAPAH